MKTILNFISVIVFSAVLTGCSAQKHAAKSDAASAESEILHQQALHALEAGRFVIEVEEFYLADNKQSVKPADRSFISMRDGHGEIRFSQDLSFGVGHSNGMTLRDITDESAEITKDKMLKNGDVRFNLKIDGVQTFKKSKIWVTLYKNTNQCFVVIRNEYNSKVVRLKGYVCPL